MSRDWNRTGAHCKGQNYVSLGLCFVGDFETMPPPHLQWERGLQVVRLWQDLFAIPTTEVYGHREFTTRKTCPGTMFDLAKFREDL